MSKNKKINRLSILKSFMCLTFMSFNVAAMAQVQKHDLRGLYDVELNINGKFFQDVMVIENETAMKLNSYQGPLKGSMEVPNIFKVPLEGTAVCSIWGNMSCSFSFFIIAKERGQEFRVNYDMIMDGDDFINALTKNGPIIFKGDAFLINGDRLGTLVARKRQVHE